MNHDINNILISNIDTTSERLPSNITLNPLSKLFYFDNFITKNSNYHNFINLQQIKNYFSKLKKTKLIKYAKEKNNLNTKSRGNNAKNIFNNKKINSYNNQKQISSLNINKINNYKHKITKITKKIRLNKSLSNKSKLNRIQSMKNFRKINLNKKFYKKNSNTLTKSNIKSLNTIQRSNSIEKTLKTVKNIPHPKAKNSNIHNKTANDFYKVNNSIRKTNLTIPIKYNFYEKTKNIRNNSYIINNNNQNDSMQLQNSNFLKSRNNNIILENNKNEKHYYSYFKQNNSKIFDVRKHLSNYYKLKSRKRNTFSGNIKVKKIDSSNILTPTFIKNENKSDNNMNNNMIDNKNDDIDNSINNNKYEYTFKNCNNNDCISIENKEKNNKKLFDKRKEDLLQLIYFSDNLGMRNKNIKL